VTGNYAMTATVNMETGPWGRNPGPATRTLRAAQVVAPDEDRRLLIRHRQPDPDRHRITGYASAFGTLNLKLAIGALDNLRMMLVTTGHCRLLAARPTPGHSTRVQADDTATPSRQAWGQSVPCAVSFWERPDNVTGPRKR
jgi:hypothetical protein